VNSNSAASPDLASALVLLNEEIVSCDRCTRLTRYRQEIAAVKRRAWRDWDYWGKPVPSFGDPYAQMLILGLAPAAHGANRTGRMFTGDRSGDYLYRSLYRAGFASQPESRSASDGLMLRNAWITASAHCAPPDNKPLPEELLNCRQYLERELDYLPNLRVVVALGKVAFDTWLRILKLRSEIERISDFQFGHNVLHPLRPAVLCSYHPSQQNTSTGKLTQAMLDDIFLRARDIIQSGPAPSAPRPSSPQRRLSQKRQPRT
jgi:uracil-DNA glycosylase family 4